MRRRNESRATQVEQQGQLAAETSGFRLDRPRPWSKSRMPKDQLTELLRCAARWPGCERIAGIGPIEKAQARNPVSELRQKLNQMPDKLIPELKVLDERNGRTMQAGASSTPRREFARSMGNCARRKNSGSCGLGTPE